MAGKKMVKRRTPESSSQGKTPLDGIEWSSPLSEILPEGTKILVAFGAEKHQAVKFCSVEIGPYSIEMTSRTGECADQVYARGKAILHEIAERDFEEKIEGHLDRIRRIAAIAQRARG